MTKTFRPPCRMKRVKSSHIYSVGYDVRYKVMWVRFTSHDLYCYLNVPLREYLNLLKAPSKGKYLAASIKAAGYAYRKVTCAAELRGPVSQTA